MRPAPIRATAALQGLCALTRPFTTGVADAVQSSAIALLPAVGAAITHSLSLHTCRQKRRAAIAIWGGVGKRAAALLSVPR